MNNFKIPKIWNRLEYGDVNLLLEYYNSVTELPETKINHQNPKLPEP